MTATEGPSAAQVRRKSILGISDQIIASFATVVVTIFAARSLSVRDFGTYALIYSVVTFLVGLARATWCEVALAKYSSANFHMRRRMRNLPLTRWSQVVVASAPVAALLLLAPGPSLLTDIGAAICLLGGAGLVDALRMSYLAQGQPASALVLSGILLVLNCVAVQFAPASPSGVLFMLAGSTWLITLCNLAIVKHRPQPFVRLSKNYRELFLHGRRYGWEYLVGTGSYIASTYVASAALGLSAASALRGTEVLYGPVRVVVSILPSAVVAALGGRRASWGTCLKWSALLLGASSVYVAVVSLVPVTLLGHLLGESAGVVHRALPWIGIGILAMSASTGAIVGLRSRVASRRSSRTRSLTSPLLLVGALVGSIFGIPGVGAGLAAASMIATVAWWLTLRRVVDEGNEREAGLPRHRIATQA